MIRIKISQSNNSAHISSSRAGLSYHVQKAELRYQVEGVGFRNQVRMSYTVIESGFRYEVCGAEGSDIK